MLVLDKEFTHLYKLNKTVDVLIESRKKLVKITSSINY